MTKHNPPVTSAEIFGWAMYDFANSSYTTIVVSFIYSAFFVDHIVPPELDAYRNSFWSLAVVISTGLSMILAPFVGALCDKSGRKKRYLAVCTVISVLSTALLYFVGPGHVTFGITLLVFSNAAWMISESFIASFLPDISTKETAGKVSGIGWGIGYLGGLLSLLVCAFLILKTGLDEDYSKYLWEHRFAMVFVAVFYAAAAIPTFVYLKNRGQASTSFLNGGYPAIFKEAISDVLSFKALMQKYPVLSRFFIAFMVYSAGIAIVVKFFGIYASSELGIGGTELLIIGATLQVSSMVGAIGFGFIQDRVGPTWAIQLSILVWVVGLLGIYFLEPINQLLGLSTTTGFTIMAFFAGSAMGATQSSSRAVVSIQTDKADSTMMFGFWNLFGKLAIILGMVFGPIADAIGRHQALLVILVYFVIGALLLFWVKLPRQLSA